MKLKCLFNRCNKTEYMGLSSTYELTNSGINITLHEVNKCKYCNRRTFTKLMSRTGITGDRYDKLIKDTGAICYDRAKKAKEPWSTK